MALALKCFYGITAGIRPTSKAGRMSAFNSQRGATGTVRAKKLFTVDEANCALILVRRIVIDILDDYGRLTDLQETIESAQQSGEYDRAQRAQNQLVEAVERIQDYVEELDEVGVDLKDWTLGVVDFPSMADGREVALCWQAGESEVAHWHEVDQESCRQPLETLPIACNVVALH
jgi:hypothetical protein